MSLLLAVVCACQVAAASPPLVVRTGDQTRTVPTQRLADGTVTLRADLLADALGGQLIADGGPRYHLQLASSRVDVVLDSRFVIGAGDTLPLPSAVVGVRGRVFLPHAFVSDALPRVAGGLIYDARNGELRRFGSVGARRPDPTAATSRRVTATSSLPVRPATRSPRTGARQRIVVVDAGHGGPDNGMSGPIGSPRKVFEKDITLAVARQLRIALERRGITVVMTRHTDTLIALGDRGRMANEAKADLFLSVHVNAANPHWKEPGGARGFETYFLAEAKTEDERRVAAMENEAIRFETSVDASRGDPLGFIIRDMAQNEHLRESARLADLMQSGMAAMHPGPNRGVKQAGFRVLVTAFMPAVLVEIGFGTNRAESEYLTTPETQRALAETLADAAVAYLEQYERKVGSGA